MPPSSLSAIVADRSRPSGARLRLLLLTDTSILSAGGSERFLRNLLSRLPPEHYDITVVQLTEASMRDNGHPLFDVPHVHLRTLPVGAVYGSRGRRALRELRRLVRQERFDVMQSQHEKSDLLNALLPRAKGTVRISNRRDMGFNKSSRLQRLFRLINHRFDCVVAPARPILAGLGDSESLDFRRTLWIPNGVDTERFRPQPARTRSAYRRALGLDDGAVAFGCVASLTPVKRHSDLIDAFALLHRRAPQARLLLIGDGRLRAGIEQQIAALDLGGAVSLLGERPDIEHVLSALDVAVLCSSTEGMSNAILEAMASGLPIVATAVGGNLQLVRHQVSGLLVPACEPAALAAALIEVADAPDLRRRMGEAGRTRIEREFSLDGMASSFDQLYRRLLGWT